MNIQVHFSCSDYISLNDTYLIMDPIPKTQLFIMCLQNHLSQSFVVGSRERSAGGRRLKEGVTQTIEIYILCESLSLLGLDGGKSSFKGYGIVLSV